MTWILWVKALHIAFMVSWFAGIFYLPRLFVYHAMNAKPAVDEQLCVMERRLLYFVTPFAILTLIFGVVLIFAYGSAWFAASGWMHTKLVLVLFKDFKTGNNRRSHRFYRVFNELPVLALFAIIILAVVKPY